MSVDWQAEIIGDRKAWFDALNGVVTPFTVDHPYEGETYLDRAASVVVARLAADRNGSRILIRGARYEEHVGIGSRFMVRPVWRWQVYVVGPHGDRLIGKTFRFRVAERWLGPWDQQKGRR